MLDALQPLTAESLKDVFVKRFEDLILSGKLPVGSRLPSERELALQLHVSRPVVHEGLVDLAARGLIEMRPRHGSFVSDYRKHGSLAMLNSLVSYHNGNLSPELLQSLLEMRALVETETAGLAAARRTDQQLEEFREILRKEAKVEPHDVEALVELDFEFHHLLAIASGNLLYPMLLNSFKQVYTNFTRRFFSGAGLVESALAFHGEMVIALENKDEESAANIMCRLLGHGEVGLKRTIRNQQE